MPLSLGPGFRLGARWNRLVKTVKTRKRRGETGEKWARYGLKRAKESGSPGGCSPSSPRPRPPCGSPASSRAAGTPVCRRRTARPRLCSSSCPGTSGACRGVSCRCIGTCSGEYLCQLTPTLFRPFLAHFFPFFPHSFAVPSVLPARFRKPAPRPGKRSVTVGKRRAKNPKLT